MATARLKHSPSNSLSLCAIQSRCAQMCLAASSHSFQYCLNSINPPILKWTSREKKITQAAEAKRPFYFHWTLWLLETAAWPWAISGPFRHTYSQHKESASHNVALRKTINRKRTCFESSSKWKTLLHVKCLFSIPWLVNINGGGKSSVDPLKSNLQSIYWICLARTNLSTEAPCVTCVSVCCICFSARGCKHMIIRSHRMSYRKKSSHMEVFALLQ